MSAPRESIDISAQRLRPPDPVFAQPLVQLLPVTPSSAVPVPTTPNWRGQFSASLPANLRNRSRRSGLFTLPGPDEEDDPFGIRKKLPTTEKCTPMRTVETPVSTLIQIDESESSANKENKLLPLENWDLLQQEAQTLAIQLKKAQQDNGQKPKAQKKLVEKFNMQNHIGKVEEKMVRGTKEFKVARALAVFSIDEVVIYNDQVQKRRNATVIANEKEEVKNPDRKFIKSSGKSASAGKITSGGSGYLARILKYLECPPYLRKHLFPTQADLKNAGLLNPPDMPHHLNAQDKASFREAVVLERPPTKRGSFVDAGMQKTTVIDKTLQTGLRVTIKLNEEECKANPKISGQVVSSNAPRTEAGLYWGYQVRVTKSLSSVLSECPFQGGYDLTIGISERGSPIDDCTLSAGFKHLLIVFGGVRGLEGAMNADELFKGPKPPPLFDHYLNICPSKGSKTIRTEEAVLISLAALRPKISAAQVK